jgi:hypothetical protein
VARSVKDSVEPIKNLAAAGQGGSRPQPPKAVARSASLDAPRLAADHKKAKRCLTDKTVAFSAPKLTYYGPFERGGASTGQLLATMPEAARHAVREEMRQALNDTGGPIAIDVEHRIASGRRQR